MVSDSPVCGVNLALKLSRVHLRLLTREIAFVALSARDSEWNTLAARHIRQLQTDHLNRRVRKVNSAGMISTFAGNGGGGCSGDGGLATNASFGKPTGLLIDSGSLVGGVPTLLVGNACQARIRGVNLSTNIIHTFAGSVKGFDGSGSKALASKFLNPAGVIVDSSGDLLIGDGGNDEMRKVNASTTIVTAFAGGYLGNGGAGTSPA